MHPLAIATLAILPFLAVPNPAQAASATSPAKGSLGLPAEGTWKFFNGREFPGANGKLNLATEADQTTATISYDFSGGGLYVCAQTKTEIPVGTGEIRIRVKSEEPGPVSLRLVDSTGQKLSIMTTYTQAGEWQVLRFPLSGKIRHFGGANDGKIHFPVTSLSLLVHKSSRIEPSGTLSFTNFQLL
ncbi:hypothetical protein [Geminisphaera colitermitum]|uniref:hypothetical protein n=1 Tax=Geminisphaera colitermitum TaxID=1148786 RepID=UPI000158C518|nr:hypothetical protein [Geminisphaera colitermitum]